MTTAAGRTCSRSRERLRFLAHSRNVLARTNKIVFIAIAIGSRLQLQIALVPWKCFWKCRNDRLSSGTERGTATLFPLLGSTRPDGNAARSLPHHVEILHQDR